MNFFKSNQDKQPVKNKVVLSDDCINSQSPDICTKHGNYADSCWHCEREKNETSLDSNNFEKTIDLNNQ